MPHPPNDYEQRQPAHAPQHTNYAGPLARANVIVFPVADEAQAKSMPMIRAALFAILLWGWFWQADSVASSHPAPSPVPTAIDSQDTVSAVVSDGILKNGGDFITYTLPLQIVPDKVAAESFQTDGTDVISSGPVIRWLHQVRVELDDGKPILKLTLSAQIARDASGNTVPDHDPIVIAKIIPQPLFGIPEQPPPHPDVQDLIRSEAVPKAQLGATINGSHIDYATLAANTYNTIVIRDRLALPLMNVQEVSDKRSSKK